MKEKSTTTLRQRKLLAIGLLFLLVVCFSGVAANVVFHRMTAETFLAEATALQLHLATLPQIKQLASRYGGRLETETCDSRGCAYFFSFDNGWLHRLRLAPFTRLTCTLGYTDGVLGYRR